MTMSKAEEEKEGKESLVMVSIAKVVEYLETLMSKELLCKFPDNSAFDLDYTQSSIRSPMDLDFDLDIIMPQKLSFGMGLEVHGFREQKPAQENHFQHQEEDQKYHWSQHQF
ncbi:hypothetical protein CJ030_MR7G022004 [Morella rubra]|uniref:Uncharacterized protein n=1 Tax=Morella rubra TaxID=262757 RepID=A0A6A1UZF2_9ROSI|nr:hypothetical protein CJ030_MR7G022004 [Morella rubra]